MMIIPKVTRKERARMTKGTKRERKVASMEREASRKDRGQQNSMNSNRNPKSGANGQSQRLRVAVACHPCCLSKASLVHSSFARMLIALTHSFGLSTPALAGPSCRSIHYRLTECCVNENLPAPSHFVLLQVNRSRSIMSVC